MYCSNCGRPLPREAYFCPSCGAAAQRSPASPDVPVTASASPAEAAPPVAVPGTPAYVPSAAAPPASAASPSAAPPAAWGAGTAAAPAYGGFWRRFWATLLDHFLLGIIVFPIGMMMSLPMLPLLHTDDMTPDQAFAFLGSYMSIAVFGAVVDWLYFALMESSSKQATLGKLALGLRVTNDAGRRISFGRATGRYFAHMITNLTLLIGYLIQVFTARRQALHDLIAGTLVVRSGN